MLGRSGVINFETEETQKAEQNLNSFLRLQDSTFAEYYSSENAKRYIEARNTLCMIMFEREEFETAESHLKEAESMYLAFQASSSASSAKNASIESLYTVTCLFFAQVYSKTEDTANSAIYCERTLTRQVATGAYDPAQIAQFCLQLTSYYQGEKRWEQTLYVIAAAYSLSKSAQDPQLYAEISLFMAKFFVEYLESQQAEHSYVPSMTQELFKFDGIELDAQFVADQLGAAGPLIAIASASQADAWCSQACKWFSRALNYFELDGYTTEHVSICLERDHLLAVTAHFHSDRKAQKAIYKRRAAYLEPLIPTLSPNHFFGLVQQLLFSTAEIYENIVDLSSLPLSDSLSPKTVTANGPQPLPTEEKMKKVNKQVATAVQYYQKFLDTIMTNGQLPTKLEEGVVESFFRSHLSLAKLHQRFRSTNKAFLIAVTKRSAEYYKLTDTLFRAYKPQVLQQELALCAELHMLLSLKITGMSQP